MNTLLTGGAGYIGTHTAIELLQHGHHVVILDNFSNSRLEAVRRVESITGQHIPVIQADVRDHNAVVAALSQHRIDSVVHFAGKKAVGESVTHPLDYFDHNVNGSLTLLRAMQACSVFKLVFSSSATVYGTPHYLPFDEKHPTLAANPYGRSKLMAEEILADLHHSAPHWALTVLRYFNPIGAHPSGNIGEDPSDIPNNLLPYIAQVAVGRRPHIQVFGNDYDTPDGTGVRDYLHVVDLARGHVQALERLQHLPHPELQTINLGTGRGYSVLEVIRAFEQACGQTLPYVFAPRRFGDIPCYYANPGKAQELLGWTAKYDLPTMCADAWRWQSANPNGYRG